MMKLYAFLIAILLLISPVFAATVIITQPGADSGTIMKGIPFTITVSGLSGSGTVNLIDLPTGFSTEEGTSKSFSEGTATITWTTAKISTIQSNIKIKVSITTAGSPSTAESSSFDVVLPPSISLSASPKSVIVNQGSSFTITLNVQNSGGTSAKSVSFSVSGTGMSISEGCAQITSIPAEGSASVLCTILASTPGTHAVTFTANPSNANSNSDSISVVVQSVGSEEIVTGGGGGREGVTPQVFRKIWSQIESKKYDVEISLLTLAVKKIKFHSLTNLSNAYLNVKPIDVSSLPVGTIILSDVYQYIYIETNINVSDVEIEFEVNNSWMKNNNYTFVRLYKYEENWIPLETTKINETNETIIYKSLIPGFSYFAIKGEREEIIQPTTTTTTIIEKKTTTTTIIEEKTEKKKDYFWMYIVVIITLIAVIAAGIMYFKFLSKIQTS